MKDITFSKVGEKDISRAIVSEFAKEFEKYVESDCIIIGGGPAGLMTGRKLASFGFKVLIVERNNYLGGGFWIGGYLMNKLTVRSPGEKILAELGVPFEEVTKGLYVADAVHACSRLIASSCDAGVKFLNMTSFEDIVFREDNRVAGVVVNWTPIRTLPREITCVDPIALESRVVIDASGHDAVVVKRLEECGLVKTRGYSGMWVERSEDLVYEHTGLVHPGLIVVGMAVTTTYGLARMGPTFAAMLLSGQKAAEIAKDLLTNQS